MVDVVDGDGVGAAYPGGFDGEGSGCGDVGDATDRLVPGGGFGVAVGPDSCFEGVADEFDADASGVGGHRHAEGAELVLDAVDVFVDAGGAVVGLEPDPQLGGGALADDDVETAAFVVGGVGELVAECDVVVVAVGNGGVHGGGRAALVGPREREFVGDDCGGGAVGGGGRPLGGVGWAVRLGEVVGERGRRRAAVGGDRVELSVTVVVVGVDLAVGVGDRGGATGGVVGPRRGVTSGRGL